MPEENVIEMPKRAAIISVFPWEFREVKPGLQPNYFHIKAAQDVNTPEITVIDGARYYVYLGDKRNFPVDVLAYDVAKSLVDDLCNSMVESSEDAHCGLIATDFVPDAAKLHGMKKQLDALRAVQTNWFRKLVDLADKDFARVQSPMAVSDLQRMAAKVLGLKKPWGEVADAEVMTNCPVCTSVVSSRAVVCSSCRAILKPDEYKKFEFAQGA